MRPLKNLIHRTLLSPHPTRPGRNSLELALFLVLAVTNFRGAVGLRRLPTSLDDAPDFFGMATAAMFVAGAMIAAIGTVWPKEPDRYPIYQVGLAMVGIGLFAYGAALIAGPSSWANVAVLVSLCWGVALGALLRYAQVWWYLRQLRVRSRV